MVSGTISLFYSKYFSPFPHGTGSLSVSREYLALPDGPGRFTQNFSCSVLLRIPLGPFMLRIRDYHPLWWFFPKPSTHIHFPYRGPTTPILPKQYWFGLFRVRSPLLAESLFIFSSCRYLDVSVPCVRLLLKGCYLFKITGYPIGKSSDQRLFAPTRSLSQLITSFFASESLGIRHVLFFTYFRQSHAFR